MKKKKTHSWVGGLAAFVLLFSSSLFGAKGQTGEGVRVLTLDETIHLAADSSLEAFRTKNLFLSSYWEYRTYRAERLPSISLQLTPAEYYSDFTRRYDSEADIDIYRRQQSFYAGGAVVVEQNFDLLGGTFTLDSDLGYIRNIGSETYSQYTSVPVRIGYTQSLIGYNPFRWEKKIEPLKYEKAKKELLFNIEQISEQATSYFFTLAMAQAEYDLARANLASTDSLYRIGEERHKIASITKADLLTLKLDAVNARNTFQNADITLKRAMFSLASFLNFDKNTPIRLVLPGKPLALEVPVGEALALARENSPELMGLKQQILEAEQEVDRTRKESWFDASLSASVGFNQVSNTFAGAYRDPLRQDIVSVTLTIPLVDWGVRKGKYNVAKNNLSVTQTSAKQEELSIEEEVVMTVSDFGIQQSLIGSAEEALDLAVMAYAETKQRFLIGQADISSLTLALNRQQEAQRNYITALQNYWLSYFKIRKLTLHDFENRVSLSDAFDYGVYLK